MIMTIMVWQPARFLEPLKSPLRHELKKNMDARTECPKNSIFHIYHLFYPSQEHNDYCSMYPSVLAFFYSYITLHLSLCIFMYMYIHVFLCTISRLGIQCPTPIYVTFVRSGLMGWVSSNSSLASVLCICFSCISAHVVLF